MTDRPPRLHRERPLPPVVDDRPRTDAWWVVWTSCHCSEALANLNLLPERCPGHDTPPIARPELIPALTEYVGLHQCGERSCPEETP